jgi:hypothetical protein
MHDCVSKHHHDQAQWLKPIILATWEAEVSRIPVQGQLEQKVCKTPSQQMAGCGGVHVSSQLCEEAQIRGS